MWYLIAHFEDEEGDDDDADDGPEVEELRRENGGVAVAEDGKVVAFDVEEGEAEVFPAVGEEELEVLLETVFIDCVGGVDEGEECVVEDGLESWERCAGLNELRRESIGAGNAKRKNLSISC